MQYYEIEDGDVETPTINKITESKAALANGLLGFQMNLVYSTNSIQLWPPEESPVTSSESESNNFIGLCDAAVFNKGVCNVYGDGAVHNVFNEGFKKCDSQDYQSPHSPLTLTCKGDQCGTYSGGNGYSTGPGVSCEFLQNNTGPCHSGGGGCGKGGCPSCADENTQYPYTLSYRLQTTKNTFVMKGLGFDPCPCASAFATCPFQIGVASIMSTWHSLIDWDNWVLGEDPENQNFYGSRTFSGKTPLNSNDPFNTKKLTTKPIFDTDYNIKPAECDSLGGPCSANRCTESPNTTKMASGWINGEWTWPLTTQNTSAVQSKQDTLNYISTDGLAKMVMTQKLVPSGKFSCPLCPIPPLKPGRKAGLALWLRDLVNCVQMTYSSGQQGPGFIRDYMIVKTYASMYCSTLYGSINLASPQAQDNVLPHIARANWGYTDYPDFVEVWQGSQLVGDSTTAAFNKILYDQIDTSFDGPPGGNLPFLSQLRGMTPLLNIQQLDPFPVQGDVVYLQVPIDAFRMQQLFKNTTVLTAENFNNIIITPLLRGDTSNGIITPKGKSQRQEQPPVFASNEDGSLNATYRYSGLTYVEPTTVFATTCKTNNKAYNSQINNLPNLSVIDKDLLWPLNTHATINSDNQVVTEDGGDGTPMIECLYYIIVEIQTWSPALAFLYLATKENITVIPEAVYQKIYTDTTLLPSKYIGKLCSNPDGTNDMLKCKNLVLEHCSMRYTNGNFIISPDAYFLLYNGRYSQGVCSCINSSLVPVSKGTMSDNRAAMCFDEKCSTQKIPNSNPLIFMDDLLGLSDWSCRTECDALKHLLQGDDRNIQNLDTGRYNRLCRQSINVTFNTAFFVQLIIPTIIISALIPLGFGINTTTIIITVLTLLTLTGVSFYLGKLFAPMTECDGIGVGGKLPICVSSLNNDMELPLSFCDINMFCECKFDMNCNDGCTCKSGVCVDKSGTRATETVYVKTINVQMLVLSCSLLILPILIYLLRKRFFPQMPTFLLNSINFLIISLFSVVLYLSLVYHQPRIVYKGICGQKPSQPPK